jgi:ATP-dependent DNA helicase RecG
MNTAKRIIDELNRVDEHQKIEAKSGAGKSLLESICAFANEPGMGGGIILIGVEKEENMLFPLYSAKGVDNSDRVTAADLAWLLSLQMPDLNDAQKRGLIFVRESGAIDNQTYRQLNASDTLTASGDLRRMRAVGLLEKKGGGPATYYVADTKMLPNIMADSGAKSANTPQQGANTPQLTTNTPKLTLPADLQDIIADLGKKPRIETTKSVIMRLCAWSVLSADEIASYLGKTSKKDLVRTILKPMIDDGLLTYTYPDMTNHPKQKYRTAKVG